MVTEKARQMSGNRETPATETESSGRAYPLRAVDRVCDILDVLADSGGGATLTEIAAHTGLPKSSAFRYLTALAARSYVERDVDAVNFQLGPAFRPHDARARDRLATLAQPLLDAARDNFGETLNLGILDGAFVVHVLVAESPHMMRLAARPGERGHVHSTALGKALAATLTSERVTWILTTAGMPGYTDATITELDAFATELDRVRTLGYAIDDAENQEGGRCVAVAVPDIDLVAGISLSAPAERFPAANVEKVAAKLGEIATTLSSRMGTA